MPYGYDKDTDYSELIQQDVANGDYRSAYIHEQMRNEKIRGEGITGYEQTNHFSAYRPRTEEINSGMDRLANPEPWKYNAAEDPAMQAYRKQFLREADRQTRDTMGAYAGMTGGVPSTAAVTAAQQAGNYERSKLADKVPELMQADFSRYMQGREADRADLTTLAGLDAQRAQESLELQQWAWQKQQQEIANAMQRWSQTGVADEYVAQILGVPVGTSTQDLAYQQWQQKMSEDQFAWQKQQSGQESAREIALMMIKMGKQPSASLLAQAGISAAEAQTMAGWYAAQGTGSGRSAAGYSGGNGKGGTTGSENGSGNGSGTGSGNGTDSGPNAQTNRYHYSRLATQIEGVRQAGINYNNWKRVEDAILDAYNKGQITKETADELGQMLDNLWMNP